MPFAGSKMIWRTATKLVATGSILVKGTGGAGNSGELLDLLVETLPDSAEASGFAFYVIDAFTKAADALVLVDSSGVESNYTFGANVYVSHYRLFVPGPPAYWQTYLRFTNLNSADQTISYKMYRWDGLD